MQVQFFFTDIKITLKQRTKLKEFIELIFSIEKKSLSSINYIFCSDEYLLNINRQYLRHNYYTDIITFNLSESNEVIEGEVYISVDRVKDNSQSLKHAVNIELHRVIFHGILHLCGYLDKSKTEIIEMRSKEEKYLNMYFRFKVPRGT